MFTRKTEKEGAGKGSTGAPRAALVEVPQPAAARAAPVVASGSASVVGAELLIKGNLESAGEVQVDGAVEGDVHAARIVVGPQARIVGNLLAGDVIVHGAVAGSIRGMKVLLQSASHVEGDIFHKSLAVERGAYFEGRSRRVEDPAPMPRAPNGQSSSS
jgi:cytoskeletal protein CcmA (bactofilin family)